MTPYFDRLNLTFDLTHDWWQHRGEELRRYNSPWQPGYIAYYTMIEAREYLKRIAFPWRQCWPDRLWLVEINGRPMLEPHIDFHTGSSINFYFDPQGSRTTFYEPKPGAQGIKYGGYGEPVKEDGGENIFPDLNDLTEVCAYTAEPGSVYLINTDRIHSVTETAPCVRRFIKALWLTDSYDLIRSRIPDQLLVQTP